MSRLQRAVAKAEREGLLAWTGREEAARPVTTHYEAPPERPVSPEVDRVWPADVDATEPEPADVPHISPLFVAATHPSSSAAEQYRLLRTRLEGRDRGRRAQLVLVTS